MNTEIKEALKTMLPEKLANGLTRDDVAVIYMSKHNIVVTDSGLRRADKLDQIIPGDIEDHVRAFAESFDKLGRTGKDEVVRAKPGAEGFFKGSDVAAYFEKNNTLVSEQSGILAKAMKNEGFDINE